MPIWLGYNLCVHVVIKYAITITISADYGQGAWLSTVALTISHLIKCNFQSCHVTVWLTPSTGVPSTFPALRNLMPSRVLPCGFVSAVSLFVGWLAGRPTAVKLCHGHSDGAFECWSGAQWQGECGADHQSGGAGFVAGVSSQIAFTLTAVQTKLLVGKMYSLTVVVQKLRKQLTCKQKWKCRFF